MKRTVLFVVTLAITLFVTTLLVMAQTAPSVPNLIDFQGKLTTPAGNPVANGVHTFTFRIFDGPGGGATLLWSEGPLGISTNGGLFTHQLGSSIPLPDTIAQGYDQLWLEVEADAAVITPRTRLISTPYSRLADNLEVNSTQVPGVVAYVTDPSVHSLVMNGADGLENFRVWGAGWGQILLHDITGPNNVNAVLDAGPFDGSLFLSGTSGMSLNAAGLGDGSVNLPTDAINAGEMLNEPGIASTYKNSILAMTGAASNFDTISITVPTSGYIVVNAHGFVDLVHVNGTLTLVRFTITKTSGAMDFDNFSYHGQPSGAVTGTYYTAFAITKVEAVAAGTHTYYLVGDEFSGNGSIGRPRMTAMFFPTNYGTVISTKPVVSRVGEAVASSTDAVGTGQTGEVQVITVEDSKARLEAERAKQVAELEARIKKLEVAAKLGKQQVVDDNR